MGSGREPFCSVLRSQMSEPIDASREQFARQTRRPIFSLEAVRPRPSVPSPFRVDAISRRSAIKKPFRKPGRLYQGSPRRLTNAPRRGVPLDCRVKQR
jgi:hypothetical protein